MSIAPSVRRVDAVADVAVSLDICLGFARTRVGKFVLGSLEAFYEPGRLAFSKIRNSPALRDHHGNRILSMPSVIERDNLVELTHSAREISKTGFVGFPDPGLTGAECPPPSALMATRSMFIATSTVAT